MLTGLVKGIGAGVGLVSEAITHRKEKKGKEAPSPNSQAHDDDDTESDIEDDEIAWRLDEAAEAAHEEAHPEDKRNETTGAEPPEYTVNELVDNFVSHHPTPPPTYSPAVGRLTAPVVLPQKRPRAKVRGFVRAYAPMLEDCGIDQATFLEFLDGFDKSTHVCLPLPPLPPSKHRRAATDVVNRQVSI
jgi:hypothetical protein